eukprot:129186_1
MSRARTVRIFLTGDVMLGRGIDQVLAHPCKPHLYESYVKDARGYVQIAERRNGKLPQHNITSSSDYIWGDLLDAFKTYSPDIKLINLETSITTAEDPWPHKGINYRMNPRNVYVLHTLNTKQATCEQKGNDNQNQQNIVMTGGDLVCNLANNHVLDWGRNGLTETLSTLRSEHLLFCGAGENASVAWEPAVVDVGTKCRVFIFGVGTSSSGCPSEWNANKKQSGIAMVDPYNAKDVDLVMHHIKHKVEQYTKTYPVEKDMKNIIILTIHWGGNWGYQISKHFIRFAHALIDYKGDVAIDLIHGHSSHHVKGFEIYKDKLIFYGAGDFLSDYEGITGNADHNAFHDDLSFMYFVDLDVESGRVEDVILRGSKVKQFQVNYAKHNELKWLQRTIMEQCEPFDVKLYESKDDQSMRLTKEDVLNV